jgi:hypothetical protein
VGEDLGRVRAKWSFFYARLLDSVASSDHDRALKHVCRFLRKNAAFWADFAGGNGEMELVLNHTVNLQEQGADECFELYVAPVFLSELSTWGFGLRVQGWQGRARDKRMALAAKREQGPVGKRKPRAGLV